MRLLVRTATTVATLAAAAALAAGCGSDATSPQSQFAGTYSLRTANGQSLPFVFGQDTSGTYAVASDVYTFKTDGTFSEQAVVRFTPAAGGSSMSENESYTGTWTISGTTVSVTLTGEGTFTGTFSGGNTLTTTSGRYTLVYQK